MSKNTTASERIYNAWSLVKSSARTLSQYGGDLSFAHIPYYNLMAGLKHLFNIDEGLLHQAIYEFNLSNLVGVEYQAQ